MKIPANQFILIGMSVGFSFLLWVWLGAQERSEIVVSVPLEYRNLPRGVEIVPEKDLITSVNVWVKGTTTNIKNLRPNEISAWVDLSDTKSGWRNFELGPEGVKVPYGFTVLRMNPSRISLRLEDLASRRVPVTVRLEGEPSIGYRVSEKIVRPPEVEIRGPRSAVSTVSQAVTDSINISSIQGKHQERVSIGVENSSVRIVGSTRVDVSLTISEIQDVVTMRLPVTVGTTNRQVRFSPKSIRIDLMGPKTYFAELKNEHIRVELDVEGLKPGVYELTPRVVLDEQAQKKITVKDMIPPRIHVKIS